MKNIFLILFSCMGITSLSAQNYNSSRPPDSVTLVIMQNPEYRKMIDPDGKYVYSPGKPLPAIVITDKSEVSTLPYSFGDQEMGYIYMGEGTQYNFFFLSGFEKLLFISDSMELSNPQRNQFLLSVNPYLKRLNTHPSHFIYNIEVPSSKSPEEIYSLLKSLGYHACQLDFEKDPGLPFIIIELETTVLSDKNDERAADIQNVKFDSLRSQLLKFIRLKYVVKSHENILESWSTGGDAYKSESRKIYFPRGTDLKGIEHYLHEQKVRVTKVHNPPYYFLPLFHKSSSVELVKKEIQQKIPSVSDVLPYF